MRCRIICIIAFAMLAFCAAGAVKSKESVQAEESSISTANAMAAPEPVKVELPNLGLNKLLIDMFDAYRPTRSVATSAYEYLPLANVNEIIARFYAIAVNDILVAEDPSKCIQNEKGVVPNVQLIALLKKHAIIKETVGQTEFTNFEMYMQKWEAENMNEVDQTNNIAVKVLLSLGIRLAATVGNGRLRELVTAYRCIFTHNTKPMVDVLIRPVYEQLKQREYSVKEGNRQKTYKYDVQESVLIATKIYWKEPNGYAIRNFNFLHTLYLNPIRPSEALNFARKFYAKIDANQLSKEDLDRVQNGLFKKIYTHFLTSIIYYKNQEEAARITTKNELTVRCAMGQFAVNVLKQIYVDRSAQALTYFLSVERKQWASFELSRDQFERERLRLVKMMRQKADCANLEKDERLREAMLNIEAFFNFDAALKIDYTWNVHNELLDSAEHLLELRKAIAPILSGQAKLGDYEYSLWADFAGFETKFAAYTKERKMFYTARSLLQYYADMFARFANGLGSTQYGAGRQQTWLEHAKKMEKEIEYMVRIEQIVAEFEHGDWWTSGLVKIEGKPDVEELPKKKTKKQVYTEIFNEMLGNEAAAQALDDENWHYYVPNRREVEFVRKLVNTRSIEILDDDQFEKDLRKRWDKCPKGTEFLDSFDMIKQFLEFVARDKTVDEKVRERAAHMDPIHAKVLWGVDKKSKIAF